MLNDGGGSNGPVVRENGRGDVIWCPTVRRRRELPVELGKSVVGLVRKILLLVLYITGRILGSYRKTS